MKNSALAVIDLQNDITKNYKEIIENVNNLSSISYEEWFTKQVSLSNSIWIGNGVSEQYILKINKISRDMYSEIGDDFGYVIKDGKAKLIKVLNSIYKIKEE